MCTLYTHLWLSSECLRLSLECMRTGVQPIKIGLRMLQSGWAHVLQTDWLTRGMDDYALDPGVHAWPANANSATPLLACCPQQSWEQPLSTTTGATQTCTHVKNKHHCDNGLAAQRNHHQWEDIQMGRYAYIYESFRQWQTSLVVAKVTKWGWLTILIISRFVKCIGIIFFCFDA